MISKPIVDGLERELADQADVIRIDILSEFGRNLAGLYGVRGTPTTLVVDGAGQVVFTHAGIPNAGQVREAVLALTPE